MAIKAIIFDCFGVLIMSGRESVVKDFPHLKNQLHDLTLRSDYGFISRDQFDQELSELTAIPLDEVEVRYWSKNVRNESAFDWLRELRKDGVYKIGLLSNIGIGWLDDFLPENERAELFDDVVLSGTVGMTKPDERIFELAAQRLEFDTTECIMIDDILENIHAASATGMQGIVFGTTVQAKHDLQKVLGEL